ncbi:spore germination protein [Paenibacillus sp. NFR01]|uniref:spore germination protein n=1 Tax=Paenibacillus sp. NFR01 TaxID=1566279 RepID=UPI0008BD78B3|nr:spore germination protein [Paenibacillus sp. NFR01]SEU20298.1 spore germination protein KA [Paenibacillus sp. NFR01]
MERFAQYIESRLGRQPDFKAHRFMVDSSVAVVCAYLETLVDKEQLQELVILPLLELRFPEPDSMHPIARIRSTLSGNAYTLEEDPRKWISGVTSGQCLLLIEGDEFGYLLDISSFQHRSIEEPKAEKTVRGPGEGFTENIMTNVSLIRSRVKSPQLVFESYTVGETTQTRVFLAYLQGRPSEQRLQLYRDRLSSIQTDAVFESAHVEQFLEEQELTPFPKTLYTERPDVVGSHLVNGKIAVLTDGTPYCLIAPATFFEFFISAEDYYQKALFATLLRWLRFLSFLLSVYTPSIYIALTNYRQEIIPSALLINLAAQREGVPFPAFVEAILMLLMFELLREAGIRMPTVTGQAISILGAVVLGQAAVEAGLVSAAMVIVVGITSIANFVSPTFGFGMAQRVLQFLFMFLAVILGLYGLFIGTLLLIIHLVSLKTSGEPYLSPIAPTLRNRYQDTLVRMPWSKMKPPKR